MKEIKLDFDNKVKVSLTFFANNSYEKVFHVTKGDADYDFAGVTEIYFLVKPDLNSTQKVIELKLTTGDIEISTGYMKLKFPASVTNQKPGNYKCVELIVTSGTLERTWWAGGECIIAKRGKD